MTKCKWAAWYALTSEQKHALCAKRLEPFDSLPKEIRERVARSPFGFLPSEINDLVWAIQRGLSVSRLLELMDEYEDEKRRELIKQGTVIALEREPN